MPGKVKVKVVAGKNLPVMDRSNDTTDAYVEVKLGNVTFKTDVCRKSLNPQWNSEWFRFEMDDLELQDEPLQIRLMDHDTYSANDSIGKVYIDLNPLLTNPSKTKEPSGRSMNGWIPVYDTMHGIRGEVNLMVKVELFSDLNKFRQSSCGVKFFFSSNIPEGYHAIQLHGFVEELVVNDDPEYQWIDKIRTPRASNEARQTLFSKLSGEVQRRVGLKALELGGNAVIGYKQCFDLEGESGIVVRGIGTAATLTKSYETQLSPIPDKEFLDGLNPPPPPRNPSPSPSVLKRLKSCSVMPTSPNPNHRFTTASMPESLLRPLHSNANLDSTDFGDQSLAQVILRLSTSHSLQSHQPLTPQTSCDSSIVFRRPSILESDEDPVSTTATTSVDVPLLMTTTPFVFVPMTSRNSKKKDKYSTTGLMKRSNITVMSLPATAVTTVRSSEKLKEDFIRLFKRRRSIQPPSGGGTGPKPNPNAGSYRKPKLKRHFFKIGRFGKKSQDWGRSTSDSQSVGCGSVESLGSLRSSESVELEFGTRHYDYDSLPLPVVECSPKVFDLETILPRPNRVHGGDSFGSHGHVDDDEILKAFKGLRYDRPNDEPLRLYISSIDALLVYGPNSLDPCGSSASNSTVVGGVAELSMRDGNKCKLSEANLPFGLGSTRISGSSASGGGSKEEIQGHEELERPNPSAGTGAVTVPEDGEQEQAGSVVNVPRVVSTVSPSKAFPIVTNGRRLSESDLSTPPKGLLNSSIQAMFVGAHGIKGSTFAPASSRRTVPNSDHFDMLEYPFITIYDLPPKFIQRIGGSVSARSVKLLERISNLEEPESRDLWWTELRMEIRSHARSICCNVILGYEENTAICDDVCILNATGTAALVNSAVLGDSSEGSSKFNLAPVPLPEVPSKGDKEQRTASFREHNGFCRTASFSGGTRHPGFGDELNCGLCHVPYNEVGAPFAVKMARCGVCKKGRVPDLMLATISIPSGIPVTGKSCLIQAQVFRQKKDCKGESSAKEVSDSIPFLEYELHRRLINKLKVKGMNAIFCLNVQISLGENLIMVTATGTALCLTPLPSPGLPKITAGNMKTDTQKVCQFQKVVQEAFDRNRDFYKVTPSHIGSSAINGESDSSENDSEDDSPLMNLTTGNKDTYVLEVDDSEDIEIISELLDPSPPSGFEMSNLENIYGYDDYSISKQQMFIHVWRCRIPALTLRQLSAHFDRIFRSISFKLRSMRPCTLNKIRLRLELPEVDEMQVCVTGTALGLKEKGKSLGSESRNGSSTLLPTSDSHSPPNLHHLKGGGGGSIDAGTEMMFNLECDKELDAGAGGGVAVSSGTTALTTITVSSPSSPSMSRSTVGDSPEVLGHSVTPQGSPLPMALKLTPLSQMNSRTVSSLGSGKGQGLTNFPICSIPPLPTRSKAVVNAGVKGRGIIEITTLSHIPGQRIEKYLGNLNFFFIRETTSIKEMGGPTGFVHSFVMEVMAILRGHVSALGGNALVSYFMTQLSLLYNPHKNQGQCLISVGGDAVLSLPPNPTSSTEE